MRKEDIDVGVGVATKNVNECQYSDLENEMIRRDKSNNFTNRTTADTALGFLVGRLYHYYCRRWNKKRRDSIKKAIRFCSNSHTPVEPSNHIHTVTATPPPHPNVIRQLSERVGERIYQQSTCCCF